MTSAIVHQAIGRYCAETGAPRDVVERVLKGPDLPEPAPAPSVFADPHHYPGLSFWQPWAGLMWLFGAGFEGKDVETRKGRIHYRGPIIACAGLKTDLVTWRLAYARLVVSGLVPDGVFRAACNARGVAMARFEVVDCRRFEARDGPRAFYQAPLGTRFSWLTSKIAALEPFKMPGRQGWLRVPRALVDAAVLIETPATP